MSSPIDVPIDQRIYYDAVQIKDEVSEEIKNKAREIASTLNPQEFRTESKNMAAIAFKQFTHRFQPLSLESEHAALIVKMVLESAFIFYFTSPISGLSKEIRQIFTDSSC